MQSIQVSLPRHEAGWKRVDEIDHGLLASLFPGSSGASVVQLEWCAGFLGSMLSQTSEGLCGVTEE